VTVCTEIFLLNFSKIFTLWASLSATTQQIGRIRSAHLSRYLPARALQWQAGQGVAVVYYGCALEYLANERLGIVKYQG
jgi:hypothetical protein